MTCSFTCWRGDSFWNIQAIERKGICAGKESNSCRYTKEYGIQGSRSLSKHAHTLFLELTMRVLLIFSYLLDFLLNALPIASLVDFRFLSTPNQRSTLKTRDESSSDVRYFSFGIRAWCTKRNSPGIATSVVERRMDCTTEISINYDGVLSCHSKVLIVSRVSRPFRYVILNRNDTRKLGRVPKIARVPAQRGRFELIW